MPVRSTSSSRWRSDMKLVSKRGMGSPVPSVFSNSLGYRYFEGIQGDTAKKGELFGIENIFKLHEDKLATKTAVRLLSRCVGNAGLTCRIDRKGKSCRTGLGTCAYGRIPAKKAE
jgi:hypothetical protein